jgi:hypothetical protein
MAARSYEGAQQARRQIDGLQRQPGERCTRAQFAVTLLEGQVGADRQISSAHFARQGAGPGRRERNR